MKALTRSFESAGGTEFPAFVTEVGGTEDFTIALKTLQSHLGQMHLLYFRRRGTAESSRSDKSLCLFGYEVEEAID
jgi:hypothetical protein